MSLPDPRESVRAVAVRYGISERTVRRWISQGRLKAYRVGPHQIRIDPADLERIVCEIPAKGGAA